MAIYRTVSLSFWTDSKVDERFTPEDKYFFLYLLTNPHTNLCGCYEISKKQIATETGYNADSITRLLQRFETEHHVINYDEHTNEVLILNWSKYNWTKSQKFLKAVNKDIELIKNKTFKKIVYNLANGDEKPVDKYGISNSGYPIDTTVSVTGTVTDTNTDTATGTGFSESETQELIARAHSGWANRGKK